MGKAAIYNPYLDTLGGGERYIISFAKVLAEEGFDVDLEWKENGILEKLSKRFSIKLPKNINTVKTINRGENYDICFWVSDGSIPTLRARKNYLHFQVPFKDVNGTSLLNKMKLFRIDKVIVNSNFTKKVVDKEYNVNSTVIYPPVDTKLFKIKRKLNQICYVGRFSDLVQNKGHKILIKQFKKLITYKELKDWKLILAGGTEIGSTKYLNGLKRISKRFNIEFKESPSISELKDIFGQSKIFWSAAGYDVDELKSPSKTEHFGITVVEGMSAGCVPIIFNAGGAREIIDNNTNGFLWHKKDELISITRKLVTQKGLMTKTMNDAVNSIERFGIDKFKDQILQIVRL